MRIKLLRFACTLGLIPYLAALAGAQGLYFETTNSNDTENGQKISYRPQMLRAESRDGSRITIVRLDKDAVYVLNPQQKTYRETTFAQLEARLKKAMGRAEQMREKQMENLPPDQRKQAQEEGAQMGGGSERNRQVIPTDETRTIEGHRCTKYIVTRNGQQEETLWVTKDVPGADTLHNDIVTLASRFSDVAARYGLLELAQKIDGFPIERRAGDNVQTITNIQKTSFPEKYFEVPSGYTMMKGKQGGAGESGADTDKD